MIDHSVQVDYFGSADALAKNTDLEFERNRERYAFLKWGQSALHGFRAVPPGTGIVHQVNIEYLARVVFGADDSEANALAYPDTAVGTDSHTTMVNGLGVLAWGVGGIEAEAAMLGQPVTMLIPEVIGFRLDGALREGVTATDLVLTVTQMLRKKGVVGKFVEFYGNGTLGAAGRGSHDDRQHVAGVRLDGGDLPDRRSHARVSAPHRALAERKSRWSKRTRRRKALFRTDETPDPEFSDTLALDLSSVEPNLAGPRRPQDRVPLRDVEALVQHGARGVERGARRVTALRSQRFEDEGGGGTATIAHDRDRRRRRRGRDRRDHELHEHLEPVGAHRRGPARA